MKLLRGVKKRRQISALERLEKQLQSGMKKTDWRTTIELTSKDIIRIKKEIEILKSRV